MLCVCVLLAAISPGHNFPARHVIHVNSPTWKSQNAVQNLDKAINNILKLADDKQLKVIAIPSVSSGGLVVSFLSVLVFFGLLIIFNFSKDILLTLQGHSVYVWLSNLHCIHKPPG